MLKFFSILLLILFCSCNDTATNKIKSVDTSSTLISKRDTFPKTEKLSDNERALEKRQIDERERIDSIRLMKALNRALEYAEQNKNRISFQRNFEMYPDDTSYVVNVELTFGNLFDKNRKHLLLRRKVSWIVICDIYLLENNNLKRVVNSVHDGMTYITDTMKDVNGDLQNDFLIHWYPSAGCCLANIYYVYLYQPQNGGFSNDFEFINPTFFPDEKIIRGLEYGHLGEAGLYKYKWNGLQVDTIEFIYPSFNQKGKLIKTKRQEYRPTEKDGIVLKRLPSEYKKMNSEAVSWFLGNY